MTIDKCWALSSLIFYLFFVDLRYLLTVITMVRAQLSYFSISFFLTFFLTFFASFVFKLSLFFIFLSLFCYFILREKTAAKMKYLKVPDLMYQSPTDLKHLPKVIIMTRENHHHRFAGFIVRRRDQTSRRTYYKCLKYILETETNL